MRVAPLLLALSLVEGLALLAGCGPIAPEAARDELILCGREEVFIVDVADPARRLWSWRAADRPELPEALRPKFRTTDECKPVDGGARILITSSGGAAALVDRATGRALWWAAAVNAHSAELLPRERVVVAASVGAGGNRLLLFDLASPDRPLWQDELISAHGLVWDGERRRLWALGGKELRAYRLQDWDGAAPTLERTESHALPDEGGHDLRPVPGTARLFATTHAGIWLFDRDRKRFEVPDEFPDVDQIKSVDVHPRTGRIAWIRAETSWWAPRVRLLGPEGEVPFPGLQLYKARWN